MPRSARPRLPLIPTSTRKKLCIGVLYGGNSSERGISLKSGRAVQQALKKSGFRTLWLDPKNRLLFQRRLKKVDLAFVVLHGQGGEDGQIQRQLEKAKIPYVGSDPRASLRAFDKAKAKQIFKKMKISTPKSALITRQNWKKRALAFPKPYFVKPTQEGSSIGIFEVRDFTKYADKFRNALQRHSALLVEEKIVGREFTVGVLGGQPLPVIELKPKRSFYDFRAKYTAGMTQYCVPASISQKKTKSLMQLAKRTHRALGLRDYSRIDFMMDRSGRAYVLEANSIPGFTELSLLPKAARARGISFRALCQHLVAMAYQRRIKKGPHYAKKET